jgi:hypothetical protein
MTHDPTRDCEHGRLKGKCDVCDLQAEAMRLIDENQRLRAELKFNTPPAPQPVPVKTYHDGKPWPCVIAEADFEQNTITLEMKCSDYKVGAGQHWLHTTPPAAQKPWVGLTDEDRKAAFESLPDMLDGFLKTWGWLHFSKAIEAKLKEKNA